MARSNIFEQLSNSSIKEDLFALDYLIHSAQFSYLVGYSYTNTTIEQFANKKFHNWGKRGSSVSLDDVRTRLGFRDFEKYISNPDNQITYLEYAKNVLDLFVNVDFSNACLSSPVYINAKHNCDLLIEKMSLKAVRIDNTIGSFILVSADPIAISVAEKLSQKEIQLQILQYHHHLLKGDIEKKKSILLTMSLLYEDNYSTMESGPFSRLTKDIGFVLNNFNIRHSFSSKVFSSLSKQELETVYDELYEMMITWLSALTYVKETSSRIENYRKISKET